MLESALYVDDMPRAVAFFSEVLGLPVMEASQRATAFDAGRQGTLILYKRGASAMNRLENGGTIPGHDGEGPLHMAFAISAANYDPWRQHLNASGVTLRGEVAWPTGGRSIYFEDPDGHIIELATPGLWPNYLPP